MVVVICGGCTTKRLRGKIVLHQFSKVGEPVGLENEYLKTCGLT